MPIIPSLINDHIEYELIYLFFSKNTIKIRLNELMQNDSNPIRKGTNNPTGYLFDIKYINTKM